MSIVTRKTDAATLTDKLVTAREKYNSTKSAVLEQAVARRGAIGDTITDLQREDAELASVESAAKQ